jgi:aminomethyltransferase
MVVTELTEKLAKSGAHTAEYRGAQTVAVYSDTRSEFAALRTEAGVFDLGWRAKIVITGSDRTRWLNGMITNNVRDLAVNQGVYAFQLNPQGRIQADLYAYNRGDYFLIDTDQSQAQNLLGIFDHYVIMDEVEIVDKSEGLTAIGIAGPKSREVMRSAGLDIPELGPLQTWDATWREIGITVVPGDSKAFQSYEVWLAPANVGLFWDTLVKTGAVPAGSDAYELFRIAAGIPRYGSDIRERDLPQETEQARALHFNKGCYVGQEIVERIHSRGNVHRTFTGFVAGRAKPTAGSKIHADGKDIGEVTSTATLPLGGEDISVALGYIRRQAATPGKEVRIADTNALVSTIPFAKVF